MIRELWHENTVQFAKISGDRRLYYRSAEIKRATERENRKCSRFHAVKEVRWSIGGDLSFCPLLLVLCFVWRSARSRFFVSDTRSVFIASFSLSPSPLPSLSFPLLLLLLLSRSSHSFSLHRHIYWLMRVWRRPCVLPCVLLAFARLRRALRKITICRAWRCRDQNWPLNSVHDRNEEVNSWTCASVCLWVWYIPGFDSPFLPSKILPRKLDDLPKQYVRRLPGADWDLNSTDLGRFKWWVNRLLIRCVLGVVVGTLAHIYVYIYIYAYIYIYIYIYIYVYIYIYAYIYIYIYMYIYVNRKRVFFFFFFLMVPTTVHTAFTPRLIVVYIRARVI